MKEFNLSEKILDNLVTVEYDEEDEDYEDCLKCVDVKEFIKVIKKGESVNFKRRIDKLAGEKLI